MLRPWWPRRGRNVAPAYQTRSGDSANRIWLHAAATPGSSAATSGSRKPGSTTMSLLRSSTAAAAALDRRLDPGVDAAREAGVPAHPDHDGLGKLGLHRLGAAVARAVVDDDHLERRVVDPRERGEALERVVLAVPGEDDHRDAVGLRDLRHRRHDHRYLCSRAAHELRDSATSRSRRPRRSRRGLPCARRAPQLGAPDRGPRRRDRAHRREHDRPHALPRRRRLRPLHRPHRLPPDRRLAVRVRAQRHRDSLVRERRAAGGRLRLADRAPARALLGCGGGRARHLRALPPQRDSARRP